jgi:uncharacterized membrane protein
MAAGSAATDPIVRAIARAEAGNTAEIRVHVSRRLFEPDARARALRLFDSFGMAHTRHRNAVLLYINLRRRRFAIVADRGATERLGHAYWDQLSRQLAEDLRSTDPERAIALAVGELGDRLREHFPEEIQAGGTT